jgi:hypothetical protein
VNGETLIGFYFDLDPTDRFAKITGAIVKVAVLHDRGLLSHKKAQKAQKIR